MQHTLALDLKTGVLSLISTREALSSLTLRRGRKDELRVFPTEDGSPVDLPAGYTLESSAKLTADSPNALIFSPWSGVSPVTCFVQAAGSVLDGLLSVDDDPSNDVESVDLRFDVLVLDGSGEVVTQSQRVTLTIENTVTRGGETGPELAPLSARLIESLSAVTGLVGGEPEHLDSRATASLPIGWRVLVKDGENLRLFELAEDDGEELPEGAVLPVDNDPATNAKVWLALSFDSLTADDLAEALAGKADVSALAGKADVSALAGKADATALSAHTGNTSNPHGVTATQVGLGSVPNYGVATLAEAEAGTASDKLMTPERTAQAIAALAAGGGGGTVNLATDVTGTLPLANFADGAALSVTGRSANSTGVQASIAAGTDGHVLRRSGTTLGFGTVATAGIADAAVTLAKMANMTGPAVLGRTSGTAAPTTIAAGSDGLVLRRSGTTLGFGTLDLGNDATFTGERNGVTNGGNAASGRIGQFIEDETPSPTDLTLSSGTEVALLSMLLSAGDWDLEGIVTIAVDGGTCEERQAVFALDDSPIEKTRNYQEFTLSDSNSNIDRQSLVLTRTRVSISSDAIASLNAKATFSAAGNSIQATGYMSARRVR